MSSLLSGSFPYYFALVMLASVVVARIMTLEMLRSRQRTLARLQERRDEVEAELRAVTRVRKQQESRRRHVERKKHRSAVRISRCREELELLDFERSCRDAHFGLLTQHVVDR